jgi:hypothetical protein
MKYEKCKMQKAKCKMQKAKSKRHFNDKMFQNIPKYNIAEGIGMKRVFECFYTRRFGMG